MANLIKKTGDSNFPIEIQMPLPKGKNLGIHMSFSFVEPSTQDRSLSQMDKLKEFVVNELKKLYKVKKVNATDYDIKKFSPGYVWINVNPRRIGGKPAESALLGEDRLVEFAVEKIPSWPMQWVKGTIQGSKFTIVDDNGDHMSATAYIAQLRKKPNNWIVIYQSFDAGIEPSSRSFPDQKKALATFHKFNGNIKYKDMKKALMEAKFAPNDPYEENSAGNIGPDVVTALKGAGWKPMKKYLPHVLPLSMLDTGAGKVKTFQHKSNPDIMISIQNKMGNKVGYAVYSNHGTKIEYKAETVRTLQGLTQMAKNVAKKFGLRESLAVSLEDLTKQRVIFSLSKYDPDFEMIHPSLTKPEIRKKLQNTLDAMIRKSGLNVSVKPISATSFDLTFKTRAELDNFSKKYLKSGVGMKAGITVKPPTEP